MPRAAVPMRAEHELGVGERRRAEEDPREAHVLERARTRMAMRPARLPCSAVPPRGALPHAASVTASAHAVETRPR